VLISPDEYAAQRGVTGRAVRKAIADGRIVKGAVQAGKRRWQIDPEIADQEWQRNTSPAKQRGAAAERAREIEQRQPAGGGAGADAMAKAPSHAQAQALRTLYQAKLLELDLKERQGLLVPKADVERVWFEEGRRVRDALRRTPQLMIGDIARAAGGLTPEQRAEVLLVLERHIVKALEGLAADAD
jgi:hypothetical protein